MVVSLRQCCGPDQPVRRSSSGAVGTGGRGQAVIDRNVMPSGTDHTGEEGRRDEFGGPGPGFARRLVEAGHQRIPNRSGRTRPTPVTAHTGTPSWAPTAAAPSDPGVVEDPGGTACVSFEQRSSRRRRPPRPPPDSGTTDDSPPLSCSRRASTAPSPPASTTNASMSPRMRNASPARSGQPTIRTDAPSGSAAASWWAVESRTSSRADFPGGAALVVGGQNASRQPPDRAGSQMPLDQPTAGRHQPGRLDLGHVGQGGGRLRGHQSRIGPGRPGHMTQVLDRVHQLPGLKTMR